MEVYPAAALAMWGLPYRGYKATSSAAASPQDVRRAIVQGLASAAGEGLIVSDDVRAACSASDDALDALIAGLVARAAATRCTWPPTEIDAPAARREGWIHLPHSGSLARVATPAEP